MAHASFEFKRVCIYNIQFTSAFVEDASSMGYQLLFIIIITIIITITIITIMCCLSAYCGWAKVSKISKLCTIKMSCFLRAVWNEITL